MGGDLEKLPWYSTVKEEESIVKVSVSLQPQSSLHSSIRSFSSFEDGVTQLETGIQVSIVVPSSPKALPVVVAQVEAVNSPKYPSEESKIDTGTC